MTLFERLLSWPIRHPRSTLALTALCVALAVWSAQRLRPTTSLESMLPEGLPAVAALDRALSDFSTAEDLLLLIGQPAGVENGDGSALLAFAERLQAAIESDPEASEIVASFTFRGSAGVRTFVDRSILPALPLYLSPEQLDDLEQRLSPAGMQSQMERNVALLAAPSMAADAVAKEVLRDPLRLYELLDAALSARLGDLRGSGRRGALLSEDGRSLLIRVTGTTPAKDIAFTRRFMAAIERAIAAAEPGELQIETAGAYPVAALSDHEIRTDMGASLVGSLVLLVALFLLLYRSPWILLLALMPLLCAIIAAFGAFALFSTSITPITAVVGAILAGLGVDYAVHYLAHYGRRRHRGHDPVGSADIRAGLGKALLAACVTSLIAFLAIGGSSIGALRDFSLIGVLGLAATFIATLTVLPALLGLLERHKTGPLLALRYDPGSLVDGIAKHRRRLLKGAGVVLVLLIGAFALVWDRPLFETELAVMQPRPNPPLETQQKIARLFSISSDNLIVHLEAPSEAELIDLAHRVDQRLHLRLADGGLQETNGVGSFGLATVLPDPQAAARATARIGELDPERVIDDFRTALEDSPFSPEAFRDYEAFLRSMLRPASPGLAELAQAREVSETILPNAVFTGETTATAQALTLITLSDPFADRAQRDATISALRQALEPLDGATLTGLKVLSSDLQETVRNDLLRLLGAASSVVILWLLLVFRRADHVVLALLPAALALAMVFLVLKISGTGLNTINLIALPLLAGIGVDDGIFLVNAFTRSRSRSRAHRSLKEELHAGAHAITVTSATTTLAFGSLLLTSIPALQSLGLVLAVGIASAWVASLYLIIPLLLTRHRNLVLDPAHPAPVSATAGEGSTPADPDAAGR